MNAIRRVATHLTGLVLVGGVLVGGTSAASADPSAGSIPDALDTPNSAVDPLVPPVALPAQKPGTKVAPLAAPGRTLQMNICNSGAADCYVGRQSVLEALEKIDQEEPTIVTLNEVCSQNLGEFTYAVSQGQSYATYGYFYPALNGSLEGDAPFEPIECSDGRGYFGSMVISQVTNLDNVHGWGNRYRYQEDSQYGEQRTFACVHEIGSHAACTTHLALDDGTAMTQCNSMMRSWIPAMWRAWGEVPTVMAGDLNLKYIANPDQDDYNVQDCVPGSWYRKGDGDVQHFMATDSLSFIDRVILPMVYTDHNALSVDTQAP